MRLENSFVLLPGVGETTEKELWRDGVTTWDQLEGEEVPRAESPGEFLEKARRNLEVGNALFFDHHLPGRETWRMYRDFSDGAAFFDIETTGLDRDRDVVTTVSFHRGGETTTLVRGRDLTAENLQQEISAADLLVSFNGKRFDIPFLRQSFGIDVETPHVDTMFLSRRLGLSGGLKELEEVLGIDREIEDVDGREAIHLWKRYEKSGDTEALEKLVRYNRLDVINLEPLLEELHGRMRRDVFEPHVEG